jgi:hypothetical protein
MSDNMRDDGFFDDGMVPAGASKEEAILAVMQSAARSFTMKIEADYNVKLEPPQQGNGFLRLSDPQGSYTFFIIAPRNMKLPPRSLSVVVADGRCSDARLYTKIEVEFWRGHVN